MKEGRNTLSGELERGVKAEGREKFKWRAALQNAFTPYFNFKL